MSFIEYNLRELPEERKISFLQAVISYTSVYFVSPEILSDDHDDDDDLPELLVDYATLLNDVCNLVGFF
jgi:hypothetical protein